MSVSPADWRDGSILVTALGDEPLAPLVVARQLNVRRVVCVGHSAVEWRVEPLLDVLRRDGRPARWIPLVATDVPAGLDSLSARLPIDSDDSIVFDLTNARGVLGFALYEFAHRREQAAPDRSLLLRVDWSDRVIRSISPDREAAEPLRTQISLTDFLEAHGKRLVGVERAQGSRSHYGDAARRIASALPLAQPLLNATHHSSWERPLRLRGKQRNERLLDALTEDGVLLRDGSAVFAREAQAFQFLHGRWLEEYLFEIADESGAFDDCASGVRFTWISERDRNGDPAVANEIDFAGTASGRATIASCKTGGSQDVNGALYELLTLAERAAGRSVVPVFATTEHLDRPARQRAAVLGIRILDADRLPNRERVLTTLTSGRPVESRES
ncbi:MAG: DUF1887 family protein [Chloroflexi bacterium]|nr:DUF1887 family protein [Chloroflexota bacterium]